MTPANENRPQIPAELIYGQLSHLKSIERVLKDLLPSLSDEQFAAEREALICEVSAYPTMASYWLLEFYEGEAKRRGPASARVFRAGESADEFPF